MGMTFDDIAFEINNTDNKMIFLAGVFDEFQMSNFAVDYNYSYLDFDVFLVENKITKEMFENKANENKILISIDRWTQSTYLATLTNLPRCRSSGSTLSSLASHARTRYTSASSMALEA